MLSESLNKTFRPVKVSDVYDFSDKCCALNLVKRAINMFMQSKLRLDPRHEFALTVLQDGAIWVRTFKIHLIHAPYI